MKNENYDRINNLIKEYDDPVKREVPSIFDEIVPDGEIEEPEEVYVDPFPSHNIHFKKSYKSRKLEDWEIRAYKIVNRLRGMNISAKNLKRMIYDHVLVSVGDAMPKEYFE